MNKKLTLTSETSGRYLSKSLKKASNSECQYSWHNRALQLIT